MTIVVLGNRHAIESNDNGKTFEKLTKGKRATYIEVPDGYTLLEALTAVTHAEGLWVKHSEDGKPPAWVASDSPALAVVLAEHFGSEGKPIEVRELETPDWMDRSSGQENEAK